MPAGSFKIVIPKNARQVRNFVLPPQPLPTGLFGKRPDRFSFATLDGGRAGSDELSGRIAVLAWFHDHPVCRAFFERLEEVHQRHRGESDTCFYAVCTEPASRSDGSLRDLMANWQGCEVALVMDRTDLGQRWSILTLGVAYRKRLLPMTWRILPFGGTGEAVQKQLLSQVAPLLPTASRVHFYGDCEFRAVGLQGYCRSQNWHWHLGVKSDTHVELADGACGCQVDADCAAVPRS